MEIYTGEIIINLKKYYQAFNHIFDIGNITSFDYEIGGEEVIYLSFLDRNTIVATTRNYETQEIRNVILIYNATTDTIYNPVDDVYYDGYLDVTGTLIANNKEITNEYMKALAVSYGGSLIVNFYNYQASKNIVDKSSGLTNRLILLGDFIESQNITNIELTLYVGVNDFTYYYCFIPKLRRYYYITSKEIVSKDFMKLTLNVDVLMSFKDLIYSQQNVFISRNATYYNSLLPDDSFPLENKITYEYVIPNRDYPTGSLVNFTLSPSGAGTNIFVSVINKFAKDDTYYNNGRDIESAPPTGVLLPTIKNEHYKLYDSMTYVVNANQMFELTKKIVDDNNLSSYVVSVVAFPFNPPSSDLSSNLEFTIGFDSDVGDIPNTTNILFVPHTYKYSSGYLVESDFTFVKKFTDDLDFLNYAPYSKYEFFIPYLGWLEVEPEQVIGNRILLMYIANYHDGTANIILYNYTKQSIIYSGECSMGTILPIRTSNLTAIRLQQMNAGINMGLGMFNGFLTTGIGIATEKPSAIASGVTGIASSSLRNLASLYQLRRSLNSINGGVGKGNFGLYQSNSLVIRHTFKNPISSSIGDLAYFRSYYGKPLLEKRDLSTLRNSGYTEIESIRFNINSNPDITDNEVESIITELKNGVIL